MYYIWNITNRLIFLVILSSFTKIWLAIFCFFFYQGLPLFKINHAVNYYLYIFTLIVNWTFDFCCSRVRKYPTRYSSCVRTRKLDDRVIIPCKWFYLNIFQKWTRNVLSENATNFSIPNTLPLELFFAQESSQRIFICRIWTLSVSFLVLLHAAL